MGKYGSLKVLKRNINEFAACFPIDDEVLTFGRNPECGVRLYYPTVSMFHCKIVFSEGHVSLSYTECSTIVVDEFQRHSWL
jgi:FHA domain